MDNSQQQLEDLSEIRKLMERSSRFLSLSGLSGIAAGIAALSGAAAAYFYLCHIGEGTSFNYLRQENLTADRNAYSFRMEASLPHMLFFFSDACITLLLALSGAYYFTRQSAKRKGLPVWDATAHRLFINLAIPLVTGGIFCLVLILHGAVEWIAPAMLIFYGLSLLQGSHYTISDIRSLGFAEIALGILASVFLLHGLLFWTLGFGILHIIYGIVMYRKYGQ